MAKRFQRSEDVAGGRAPGCIGSPGRWAVAGYGAGALRANTFGSRSVELATGAGVLGLAGFIATIYTLPQHLIPALEPLRVGVMTAALMSAGLVARWALGGASPTTGGLRGVGLAMLLTLGLLSPLWSLDPASSRTASVELLKVTLVYVAASSLLDSPERLRKALWTLALAGSVPAYFAVLGSVTGDNLLEGYRARWAGTFLDPNRLAMSVTASALLLVALRGRVRGLLGKVAVHGLLALQVAGVVVTYSRGATLGLATGFLGWMLLGRGARKVQALAVVGVVAVGLLAAAPERFWARTGSIATYSEDLSAQGRLDAWSTAGNVIRARPLTGVGISAFLSAWASYAPGDARHPYVAHNLILEIAAELGLVALLGFLILAGACLRGCWRIARREGPLTEEARGLVAALAGYLVCQMFAAYLISYFLFILLALAAATERVARGASSPGAAAGSAPELEP